MNSYCPNCGRQNIRPFYEVRDIPVHSCLMMPDRQAAVDFPRRDLKLAVCNECGFITNAIFDTEIQAYSNQYEDQQSFSPRFRAFQTELIDGLIERYDLHKKHVLEIGCSKGDFIIELCERGDNTGIGIDPSAIPDRVKQTEARVKFIADYYDERYTHLKCDFICCRHTLEHIYPTRDFVRMVRNTVGDRPDTLVFLEVPDVERVLKEQAFWDIYYEHCSYYTLGSLARVFRENNFDVIELAKDFDDQYLLLVARPTDQPTQPSLPEENDLEQTLQAVDEFEKQVGPRLADLRRQIMEVKSNGGKVAVWGSGSKCVSFLSCTDTKDDIDAIVDINPHRHGRFLAGSGNVVSSPESLKEVQPSVIFIMNPIYREEIAQTVNEMGINAELRSI